MGKTIGHTVLWPAPPAVPYRAGSPGHSSQPGSEKSLVVTVVVAEKSSCSQARSRASKQPAQLRRGKLFPAQLKTLPKATAKTPPGPAQGHPLPGLLCGKGEGAPGRGQELPAPAWARQHTGRNVPSSAGPPSACRLPHPGMAERNPGRVGGCSAEAAVQRSPPNAPPQPPILTFLLRTKGFQGNPGVCKPGGQHLPQLPKELTTPGLKGWHTMP